MSEQTEVVKDSSRATEVLEQLKILKTSMETSFYDLCVLMLESQEQGYHTVFGYGNFADWIESTPELDMSARQAFYLINIAAKARTLGLDRNDLQKVRSSKLKEIFTLDPLQHRDQMVALLDEAENDKLDEVKKKVRALRTKTGQDNFEHITLKVSESVKQAFDEAVELARANYGDVWINGEPTEAPISKCLEIICINYLNDPNSYPEQPRELNEPTDEGG